MKPVIIGAGLAGLTAALSLAPQPVILLTSATLAGESSSIWAQGGIAAALGADDNPGLHAKDTLKAGAGLCDADIVRQVTSNGAKIIEQLVAWGVQFDRDAARDFALGLEGAHRQRRIVHAGDATGAVVTKALTSKARATPSITILEQTSAVALLTQAGQICGVHIRRGAQDEILPAGQVILATGGVGGLWQHTTNPLGATGQGLALAARAGAMLGDLEFMQFHPTAIDVGRDPMPLASEALRGEGAVLIDETGARFTDEMQPRDVVARAIWRHRADGHRVFLDARQALGTRFAQVFPHIDEVCKQAGIDPATAPIPIRPAAHYHMGGVVTDARGRTSVKGLWACGEVANTGLHGANRLASNSLLEAAHFGQKVAEDIISAGGQGSGAGGRHATFEQQRNFVGAEGKRKIRALMSAHVGMLRDKTGLQKAVEDLTPLATTSAMALTALMIAISALRRIESRGAQARTDYPHPATHAQRSRLSLRDVLPETTLPHAVGA